MKRLLFRGLWVIVLMFAALSTTLVSANPPALPATPHANVLASVRNQSGGANFTWLGTPNWVINRINTFGGAFNGVGNLLDYGQAVHYISTTGALKETVIPRVSSGTINFAPTFWSPGSNSRPAQVVGAVFQPSRGNNRSVQIVVAVWAQDQMGCTDCTPDKVRFYYNNTAYYEYSGVWANFYDVNGDQVTEAVDSGAAITHTLSCVTVGIDQACWHPYSYNAVRQEPTPKDILYDAYTDFKDLYDFSVDFYVDDAVPDLLGVSQRAACATQLASASNFNNLSSCRPNVIIGASKEVQSGQPIAIMIVLSTANVRTYDDATGNYVGDLPAGSYLVIDGYLGQGQPGQATTTFMVNADRTNHYLIPATRMQGMGYNGVYDTGVAGIRDGFARFCAWGG
ncbi:MAG: hypothetical protein SF162_13005 [bacterium]|nr:hypothetical protein [bacterium]